MLRPPPRPVELVVKDALRDAGIKAQGPLRHASSTSNMVFLSGHNIVRISRTGNGRLIREAELCGALPDLAWTPEIIAFGSVNGADYLIVRRKSGSTLARWWPDMRQSQRQDAVEQLGNCMRAIHFADVPAGLAALDGPPQMLGNAGNPILPVLHGLQQLRRNRYVDGAAIDDLETKVLTLGPALDDYSETRMVHGDLTFENVLWDGSRITAILDFEWARGAPRDLDLDVLCRFLQWPDLHVDPAVAGRIRRSDFANVLGWLSGAYPELFSHRLLRQRLTLYGLAFEIRATLQNPPKQPLGDLDPLHPYARLLDVGSTGGPGPRLLTSMFSPPRSPR